MTLTGTIEEKVEIPQGVKVKVEGSKVTVSGKAGQLSRDFSHPKVKIGLIEDNVTVSCEYPKVKEKAMVGTFASHIQNMIDGVTGGFEYHMKIVYSHFPMKATVKGDKFIIENFLGEKSPRHANIIGETKITVKGARWCCTASMSRRSDRRRRTSSAPARSGTSTRASSRTAYTSVEKARKVKA